MDRRARIGGGRVAQQVSDAIDVLVHGSRGGLGVAPAKRRDHGLVALDRSFGPALLLQRHLARFDEQIVQDLHDSDGDEVACGARDRRMEGGVLGDRRLSAPELAALRQEDPLQVGQILPGRARGGRARDRGLEHAPDVHELVLQVASLRQDGGERRHQALDRQLFREGALPVAHFEQTESLEHVKRVANRATAHAEALGKLSLGRQRLTWPERAVDEEPPDPIGDLLGEPGLLERPNEPGFAAATAGTSLDRLVPGCQTGRRTWFDHCATLQRGAGVVNVRARAPSLRGRAPRELRPVSVEFVATGSAPAVSRAIEEYARGQAGVNAIVVPWESTAVTLSMAVTSVKSDGWAIEHTNLGTILLTDLGQERTRVAVAPQPPDHPDRPQFAALFERFAHDLQRRFEASP